MDSPILYTDKRGSFGGFTRKEISVNHEFDSKYPPHPVIASGAKQSLL